ncbi:MAG TPA: hypothetical protein PKE07_08040 [Lacibacter sp.]|nr:hypothetical protein [Lacibacter sp.]HMO89856.1 hypothetical protein [Lacibacter sp.]
MEDYLYELIVAGALVLGYMAWLSGTQQKPPQPKKLPVPLPSPATGSTEPGWNTRILYLSNGRQIPGPHVAYYWLLLDMHEDLPLHPVSIWLAYQNSFEVMYETEKARMPVKVQLVDLKSARNYLLDRYMLVGYLN